MNIVPAYQLTDREKIAFMDRKWELEELEGCDFEGGYGRMWFMTLHTYCQRPESFMKAFDRFRESFSREPYTPKGIISAENTERELYLHIHAFLKFKKDVWEIVMERHSKNYPNILPEDVLRRRILQLWARACRNRKDKIDEPLEVPCCISDRDKKVCLETASEEALHRYFMKLTKHGNETKVNGLIFKKINLSKYRCDENASGLFSNRNNKPSRRHCPKILVRMFDEIVAGAEA